MDTDISTQMDHVVKLLQQILHMQRVSNLSDEQVFRFNVNGETIHMALPNAQLEFIQRVILQTGRFFEASLLSQVAKMALIGHNIVVCDIGANIGNHSVYFGHILGAQTVISCEPQPHVYKTLQRNLKLNGLATKNAFNVMLGDTSGCGKVARFDKHNHGVTQLKATADGPFEMVTLDALTARYAMIGFLKLDVEGFEALVPAGAKRILSVDRPHIWVELAIGEDNMKAARARLEAHNYTEQAQLSRTDFIFSPR